MSPGADDSIFLPGKHAGVQITPGEEPIPNLKPASAQASQSLELGLLRTLNHRHLKPRDSDSALKARMSSFETASGLQAEAPTITDLSRESKSTFELYGATPDLSLIHI